MAKQGNRNYKRGREFEYKTRDHLYDLGAVYVMRAAQSKGAADLIAVGPRYFEEDCDCCYMVGKVFLVQCKRDGKLPQKERAEMVRLFNETGAKPVLAYQGPRGTPVVLKSLIEGGSLEFRR